MKNKNHDAIVKGKINKLLEKKATKMLKQDEKIQKLKDFKIPGNFLKLL